MLIREKDLDKKINEFAFELQKIYVEEMKNEARNLLLLNNTNTTNTLSKGIETKHSEKESKVISTAPYSVFVEYGTFPHWAPIAPLKEWCRIKLGDESLAYAVQKKIAVKGTPAQPFMEPAMESTLNLAIEKAVKKVFE
jgi:HK97 gp10 family phage protein